MFRIQMLPAKDGDCLLVETGDPDSPFRILIDGGRRSTLPTLLALIGNLPERDTAPIDLLVLTHVDADHVEGLLKLAQSKTVFPIGELWFNGLNHTRMAAGETHLPRSWPPASPPPPRQRVPTLSAAQALRFAREIGRQGWLWNKSFAGGPVMSTQTTLPAVPLPCGGRIVLLGPPQAKLAAFRDEIEAAFQTVSARGTPVLGGWTPQPIRDVAALAGEESPPDNTVPNGASITFVVESSDKRVLFGADAHPGDLANALRRYEPGPARIRFDAIKVPHHGSARNNTPDLINCLESPLWLVSTNGSRNHHPDPQAIARIVLAASPDKTLVFNYRSDFNVVWDDDALKAKHGYATCFLAPNEAIDLQAACREAGSKDRNPVSS